MQFNGMNFTFARGLFELLDIGDVSLLLVRTIEGAENMFSFLLLMIYLRGELLTDGDFDPVFLT